MFLERYKGKLTALIIYIDDRIIISNDSDEVERLKGLLASEFEMKNFDSLKYFLGIEVAMGISEIFLCQRKYVLDLLVKIWIVDCRPVDTLIE